MVCPTCGEPDCIHVIQAGPAIPVALVCNLIPETDNTEDPLCNSCAGTMCYKTEGGSGDTETWSNDYGTWQGGDGDLPVVSTQLLSTGETINLEWNSFIASQIVNSSISGGNLVGVFSSGGPTTRSFTLDWDVPLVGPFAFTVRNVTPGSEDIPNISPTPDSVTPAFGTGDVNTIHQVLYNDITGISQITIDFETISFATGTVFVQMDASVPFQSALAASISDTIEVMLVCNVCNDPPTTRYVDMSTGEEITDSDIISNLYNCDIDVTEEEVCVTVGDEMYTAIKRTFYASDPVDVFLGPGGNIITPDSWIPGICDFETIIAYTHKCLRFDNALPINSDATFTDATVGTNEMVFEDFAVAQLIRNEIEKAKRIQDQEALHGLAITPIVIATESGETYTFNPNGLQAGDGTTLVIDETEIVSWGANITDYVLSLQYSMFGNCDCEAVEILQWIKDNGEVFLLDVFDITYDPETGQKISLLDENLLLDFSTIGPFAGPCPDPIQVLEINKLCCNDDLAAGSPEIAAKRLAWLDASDSSLMYEGGAPIAGIDGEDVDEIRDKLDPGVAPSFVVPANVAPGDDEPPTAPTFVESGLNDLSVLNFDKTDFDRLRLDTGNPPNSSFSLFYLVSASDPILDAHACILSVGLNESDGGNYPALDGAWQLSRDDTQPSFIFRLTGPVSGVPGTDPIMIVQTGPYSTEASPSDGAGTLAIERAIAREDEFFNGQFHLITVSFDDTTQILSAYFDGELRLQMDLTPTGFQIGSDYFRIFGNRAGSAYLSGQLAEMFYADTFLTPDETAKFNSYLICKWGVDPSLVAGGLGELELSPAGSYSSPSPFVQIYQADGITVYKNLLNGQEFAVPPVPGLSICGTGVSSAAECCSHDVLTLCDTDAGGCQSPFVRHFISDGDQSTIVDTEIDGETAYTVLGNVLPCYDVPCIDVLKTVIEELNTGEVWTPASLPVSHILTGLTITVLVGAADNGMTDADATIIDNIPAGVTLTWNANQDYNTLTPPLSIDAGTGGRILVHMTLRDDS